MTLTKLASQAAISFRTLSHLRKSYNISAKHGDLYISPNGEVSVSTYVASLLFRVTYHQFSTRYTGPLVASGVTRITSGRNRYYNLCDLEFRLSSVHTQDKNIFAVCAEMAKTIKKRASKR